MIETRTAILIEQISDFAKSIIDSDTIVFDIETTGFSPDKNRVYMIGFAYREMNFIIIHQLMTESKKEEKEIIKTFDEICKNFKTLISFNGLSFDSPFLEKRRQTLHLPPCDEMNHLDIFVKARNLKNLLRLENYKQKSIELFLGIEREDMYNGGELIEIYHRFEKKPTNEDKEVLLLHNYEDVLGLINILDILTYLHLDQNSINITKYVIKQDGNICVAFAGELLRAVPAPVHIHNEDFQIILNGNQVKGKINLFMGRLKFFLKNYKDYEILLENMSPVPKNIAGSIPKESKTKATADNCYLQKNGLFIPYISNLPISDSTHVFKESYTSKKYYLSFDETGIDEKFIKLFVFTAIDNLRK